MEKPDTIRGYLDAVAEQIRWRRARPVVTWELKDSKHKRNEPLDLRNYATAALEITNPVLQVTEGAPQPRMRPAGRRRRGGI